MLEVNEEDRKISLGLKQVEEAQAVVIRQIRTLEEAGEIPDFEPVYHLTQGVTQKVMFRAVRGALTRAPDLAEWIDPGVMKREGWPGWAAAIRAAHEPEGAGDLAPTAAPRARLAYDELLANQMALAVVKLARQQIVLQAEVQEHGRRLDLLEAKLGDEERTITEAQATQISQAVKTVAIAYGKKTKKNEFGAIYGEMYRKFDTTSYKLIPAAKFQEVMDWLTEWHQAIVGDAPF